jgi:hypothetical protein
MDEMPAPSIIADVFEDGSGVPASLQRLEAQVVVEPLAAGDYRISGGVLIERGGGSSRVTKGLIRERRNRRMSLRPTHRERPPGERVARGIARAGAPPGRPPGRFVNPEIRSTAASVRLASRRVGPSLRSSSRLSRLRFAPVPLADLPDELPRRCLPA